MVSGKYGFANLHCSNLVMNVSFLLDEVGVADIYLSSKTVKKT